MGVLAARFMKQSIRRVVRCLVDAVNACGNVWAWYQTWDYRSGHHVFISAISVRSVAADVGQWNMTPPRKLADVLREFYVEQLCIVVIRDAYCATDTPVTG
jgi:hypothetical protein